MKLDSLTINTSKYGYSDEDSRITWRPLPQTRFLAALLAWVLVGGLLYLLCMIVPGLFRPSPLPVYASLIVFGLFLAVFGYPIGFFFKLCSAVDFTFSIDVASRKYEFACGVFPLRIRRSGFLEDFTQVKAYKRQRQRGCPEPGYGVMLDWRTITWPYGWAMPGLPLDGMTSRAAAEQFARQLAERIQLPYAQVEDDVR